MSRIGESKVEWGPLRSPRSSQAQNPGKTKKQQNSWSLSTFGELPCALATAEYDLVQ